MALIPMESEQIPYYSSDDPLANVNNSKCDRVGRVKTLYFGTPSNAMTVNVDYNCGTLPSALRPVSAVQTTMNGNSRTYSVNINASTGAVTIRTSDTLPSSGKPNITAAVTYI